ncbi:hypothetical protein GCM10010193_07010 [Kitasatospora atroaurantiaca]|uniref:Uncharacterized protein n=1 Tax=Kitasatospora atroaurantiaca TaxID=285545 RepID=A0A561EJ78_9ACTN|nr:hypothetical protein [Kitasatospora atroaurantiaca]TWE15664.1 hypothetical protein FB465_0587 [Kitasatospora atroaurantiaca]
MTITRRRLALIAGSVLLAGGAGGGIAMASSSTPAPHTVPASVTTEDRGADPDNIQQGDQRAPDLGKSGATGEQERSGEAPENGVSDGPGGHADSSSAVDHRFTGAE